MRSLAPLPAPPAARPRPIPSLPTLRPEALAAALTPRLRAPAPHRFPLDADGAQLSYLARAGVAHAVRHALAGRPGTALVPAYHHGVEIEAVRAAGAALDFYRVGADMRLDLDDLARRAAHPDVRVVYVTHYVGFPQPIDEVRKLCRARGQFLVEDCALALFSAHEDGRPLGVTGDAAVFCLYKTLPVPHGGLLIGSGLPPMVLAPAPRVATLHHLAGLALGELERRSPAGARLKELLRAAACRTVDQVVENVQTGTMHLDPRDLGLGAASLVRWLLDDVDPVWVVTRRRRNFRRLAEALDGFGQVLGAPLAPGVCPLFLPLMLPAHVDKRRLHAALLARGIEAVDFWGTGDAACPPCDTVDTLRRRVLELPIHQSLDDDDIDLVARTVKQLGGNE